MATTLDRPRLRPGQSITIPHGDADQVVGRWRRRLPTHLRLVLRSQAERTADRDGAMVRGNWPSAAKVALLLMVVIPAVACGTRTGDTQGGRASIRDGSPVTLAPSTGGHPEASAAQSSQSLPGAAVPPRAEQGLTTRSTQTPAVAHKGASSGAAAGPSNSTAERAPSLEGQATPNSNRAAQPTRGTPGSDNGSRPAGLPTDAAPDSPVALASVGTYSGPIGTIVIPMVQGAQVWVKHINQSGGLNGHLVRLLVYDDGGDPARHQAQVREAVEQRHIVAFLQNSEPVTGNSSVAYINTKRIPVIGVSGGEGWAAASPMYFPAASTGQAFYDSWPPAFAARWVPEGTTKLATLVCTEAQSCISAEDTFVRDAKSVGFDYVYRARASIAQPDFTAECLAARNAGAEVLFIALDQNSTGRIASSCARQGYRPKFGVPGSAAADRFKEDPNLNGLFSPSATFPYFQSGTPATDEYREAMRANGAILGGGSALGWTAGKLLEKAGVRLSEPPTSSSILAGLWSIQHDTLGGLTGPLNFVENQPQPPLSCWFMNVANNGSWASPDQFKLHCLPGRGS